MPDLFAFDATNVPPAEVLEPIPDGWYRMMVVDSAVKQTKDKRGKRLEIEATVLDGDYKGRRVWHNFNVDNPNPRAQEIACRELSALMHATGVLRIRSTGDLHNKPFLAKVYIKREDGYKDKNEIVGFRDCDDKAVPYSPLAQPPRVKRQAVPAAQTSSQEDDDLPF